MNSKFTFENFVIGDNSRFAYAASLAVSQCLGKLYNPLYLHSNSGLGKTHLMKAMMDYIEKYNPEKTVLYVSASTFTDDLMDSIRESRSEGDISARTEFKNKYRNNIDVLLIDDIQFLIGKTMTQQEFLRTFDELYNAGKQIIISSDVLPRQLKTLEEGLRTRFVMGLVTEITEPDYNTRMEILQNIMEREYDGYPIEKTKLEYIAKNIKTNVRTLEGALHKLMAYYKLGISPDNIIMEEIMVDIMTEEKKDEITPEKIMDLVANYYSISKRDLVGTKKQENITLARQICIYLMYTKLSESTYREIGRIFSGRNHSTIKYSVEKIEKQMVKDSKTADAVKEFIQELE